MNRFRILVADEHPIFRFGLCSLLASRQSWVVCGEASDGRDAVEKCRQLKPDLLILDVRMPKLNGLDVVRQILKLNPDQVVLILTAVDSEQIVRDCLDAGVRGWVFKSDGTEDLITAVETLQRRKTMFSSRVSDLILEGFKRNALSPVPANVPTLSPREREVVQLVSEGRVSKEIATMLHMTLATAETHRRNILGKLKLHSVAELVLYAIRNGILHVESLVPLALPPPGRSIGRADFAYDAPPKAANGRPEGLPQAN